MMKESLVVFFSFFIGNLCIKRIKWKQNHYAKYLEVLYYCNTDLLINFKFLLAFEYLKYKALSAFMLFLDSIRT